MLFRSVRERSPNQYEALEQAGRDAAEDEVASSKLELERARLPSEERVPNGDPAAPPRPLPEATEQLDQRRTVRDGIDAFNRSQREDNNQVVAMKEAEQRAAAPLQTSNDREGGDEPAQAETDRSSPDIHQQRREEGNEFGTEPTRPGSRAAKDEDRYLLPDGKEMTEAQRERFDRLMGGGFREAGREVTDPNGHLREGRERGE